MKEKADLQGLLSELGRELQQAKADLGEEKKTTQDLTDQLEVNALIVRMRQGCSPRVVECTRCWDVLDDLLVRTS